MQELLGQLTSCLWAPSRDSAGAARRATLPAELALSVTESMS